MKENIRTKTNKTIKFIVVIIILVIIVIALATATVVTIKTGQVGLIIRFGEIQDKTLYPGLNLKMPWEDVVKLDTRIQERIIDVGDEITQPIKGRTKDRVDFFGNKFGVSFYVERDQIDKVYLIANNIDFIESVVRVQDIAEAFQIAVSQKNSTEIYGGSSVSDDMRKILQSEVDERFGVDSVVITHLSIGEAVFSEEYTSTLTERANAQIRQEQALIENQTRLDTIKAQAEVAKIQAESEKDVAEINAEIEVVKAKAESQANKLLAESITPEVILYMEAQAREKHGWVTVQGGTPLVETPAVSE